MKINFTRHLERGTSNCAGSQILISAVRDLHSMTFLDHSKHAFNKINYERPCFMCHEMNGNVVAVKKDVEEAKFPIFCKEVISAKL